MSHIGTTSIQVKHATCKGTHRSFIHCKVSTILKPEECPGHWQGQDGKKVIAQMQLSVVTEVQRQRMDEANFTRVRSDCTTVEVRGSSGRKSTGINGIYEPTEIQAGGWPLYRKIPPVPKPTETTSTTAPSTDTAPTGDTAPRDSTTSTTPSSSSSAPVKDATEAAPAEHSDLEQDHGPDPPDAHVWLEYNPYFKSWQIKPTACLGTNRSW